MTFRKRGPVKAALLIIIAIFVLASVPRANAAIEAANDTQETAGASSGSYRIGSFSVLVVPFRIIDEDTSSAGPRRASALSVERRRVMEAVASGLVSSGAEVVGVDALRERMPGGGADTLDMAIARDIAKSAGADFILTGSLAWAQDGARITWKASNAGGEKVASGSASSVLGGALVEAAKAEVSAMTREMGLVMAARPAVRTGEVARIVISGNRRIDTEAIVKKLRSKEGAPYNPDDVREDIRTIHGTGYFDDVSVDLTDTASGKVLTFILAETPFVKEVRLEGNSELKEEVISGVVTVKENTVLDRAVLADNVEKIRALYAEHGFYLATVTTVILSDGLDASVVFKIDEGAEVTVQRITFIGNSYFSERKLKKLINTKEHRWYSFITQSGKFNEFLFQNDLAIIMSSYFDEGFINADIVDHRVILSEDKKHFHITVALTEGERYTVGKVDASGDLLVSEPEIVDMLGLTPGEYFNRTKLGKGISKISELYGDDGYAYADIDPLTRLDESARTVDIMLEIKKNEVVYIERIDITGNTRTRDKVIRREMELEEGKKYSSSELKRSNGNLRRLGYFEDVGMSRTRGSAPDKMKLDIEVAERPTGSVSVGIGYSSVDNLIGTAQISQSNFMGKGIKLELSGTVSSSSSNYVLSITEPWLFDKPLSAGFDLYNTTKEYPDFEIEKKGGSVRFGFPLQKRYTRMHLTYKFENVDIFNVESTASSYITDQTGKNTESSVKALVRHDTRNDAFFPSEGSVVTASVEFAGGPLGGDAYFVKYEGDAIKYIPLPLDTTFSLRGALGFVQGFDKQTVPIYERYFLGGINTIRGFETRTVGPKEGSEYVGGNTMMLMNAEFVFPLFTQQKLRGVLFYDAGNAYKGRIDFSNIRQGAGVGVRWFSPMGPLRLELGFNLDRRAGEKSRQWEFTVGTLF